MHRLFGIAYLLAALTGGVALASEPPEEKDSKTSKAEKVIVVLAAVGLDTKEVKGIVRYVDENTNDGYFRIAEERTGEGTLKLHYALEGGVSSKQVELRYTPDDSNFLYTARRTGAMVQYQLKF